MVMYLFCITQGIADRMKLRPVSPRSPRNRWLNAHLKPMDDEGLEQPSVSSGKHRATPESGAESGAILAETAQQDLDLQTVIGAWPGLPTAVKAGLLAAVRSVVAFE